jgi:hypothetical protein
MGVLPLLGANRVKEEGENADHEADVEDDVQSDEHVGFSTVFRLRADTRCWMRTVKFGIGGESYRRTRKVWPID